MSHSEMIAEIRFIELKNTPSLLRVFDLDILKVMFSL